MFGAITAAYVSVNLTEVGGLANLLNHPNIADKLSIFPDFFNWEFALFQLWHKMND
jgi:hypothetical protein